MLTRVTRLARPSGLQASRLSRSSVLRHSPLRHSPLSTSAAKASLLRDYLTDKTALFKSLDTDGNAKISADELKAALEKAAGATVALDECERMLKECDKDGSGAIEMDELLGVLTKGTLFDGVNLGK